PRRRRCCRRTTCTATECPPERPSPPIATPAQRTASDGNQCTGSLIDSERKKQPPGLFRGSQSDNRIGQSVHMQSASACGGASNRPRTLSHPLSHKPNRKAKKTNDQMSGRVKRYGGQCYDYTVALSPSQLSAETKRTRTAAEWTAPANERATA